MADGTVPPLPPGFTEVSPGVFEGPWKKIGPNAYRGRVRVTLGLVDEDHHCDEMGCSSAGEHVVSRVLLDRATVWSP